MFNDPYRTITENQADFIRAQGAVFDTRGWTVDYRHDLFAPLHPDTVRDFTEAGELTDTSGGRLAAPHGSTALAINMFDPWRGNDLAPLGQAMGVDVDDIVGFEKGHGFGFPRPSQPDIEFATTWGSRFAVEVKLREPYGKVTNGFASRYFDTPGLWDGLPALHELAIAIHGGDIEFTTLHAAQLIKHALGLTASYGQDFVLGYLWHYVPSAIGDTHVRELAEFTAVADADITFVSFTVAQLLERIDRDECDLAWYDYVTRRYIPTGLPGTMDAVSTVGV